MRKLTVGAAVAAAMLGCGVASATQYNLFISGASAQRSFWEGDLGAICTGAFGTGSVTIQKVSGGLPDIEIATCTVVSPRSGVTLPSGLANGDVISMQYAAELGSVWGIAPFISGNAAAGGRRFVDPTACSGTTCTVTGYNRQADTASAGMTGKIVPDLGVTDAEPSLWQYEDNWPYDPSTHTAFAALSPQPTSAQLITFQGLAKRMNGQVLSAIVDNTAGSTTGGLTNLSQQSLRSIFSGAYTTWSQVPEAKGLPNASTSNIFVCRREHGSGTQVTASLLFTKAECGGSGRFVSQDNGPSTPANQGNLNALPQENSTTNDLVACVAAHPGVSIGVRSLSPNAAYTTLTIDGVQANAHNAAAGYYPYAFDSWIFNNVGTTHGAGTYSNIVTALLNDASKLSSNALAAESGFGSGAAPTDIPGPWTSSAPKAAYFTKVAGSGNSQTIANLTTTTKAPVALFDRAGDSCGLPVNSNN